MSLEAFLADVEKPESSGEGSAFVTIAKTRVFLCYQGWTNGQSELFEYEAGDSQAEAASKVECQSYIESGVNDFDQWPQKGICTHIYGDDVPTNAEGNFHWGDIHDFAKKYESDLNFPDNFTEDKLKLVSGSMPFNLIVEGVKDNPSVADWKIHWVKMSQEINQWSKAKGKKNKKGYDLRVHVIQHVYANEAEAKADAETIMGSRVFQPQIGNGQLSKKAIETWGDKAGTHEVALASLMEIKPKIENAINNAINGIGVPKKSETDAQVYAAGGYNIEVSDLALLGIEIEEAPF